MNLNEYIKNIGYFKLGLQETESDWSQHEIGTDKHYILTQRF